MRIIERGKLKNEKENNWDFYLHTGNDM